MPNVVAVINQKGGVGKTTTVVNLAAALSRLGHPVCVVDIDPQANASSTLGKVSPYEARVTAATLLMDNKRDEDMTAPWYDTIEKEVRLIYGHVSLTKADRELPRVYPTMPSIVLKRRLEQMAFGDDDIVLIDCPPTLSILTINALVASDYYLTPMMSGSKYSITGYEDLMELVRDVVDSANPALKCLGILVTQHDGRKNVCKSMRGVIERRFGDLVFKTAIPLAAKIQESESLKKTIFQLDRQSNAAREFMDLGRDVLARMGLGALAEPEDMDEPVEVGAGES